MKEKKNIIPDEYLEREYNLEDWQKLYVEEAVQKALSGSSYPKPAWWDDEENGSWSDCIGTVTSFFGDDSIEIGNQTFQKNHEQKGFRKLSDNEKLSIGDIIAFNNDRKTPYHAAIVTSFDENNQPLISYSNGSGQYKVNTHSYNHFTHLSPNAWTGYNGEFIQPTYYRFVGTPAQQQQIQQHNATVRAQNKAVYGNEKGVMAPARPTSNQIETAPAPTPQIPTQRVQVSEPPHKKYRTIFDVAREANE